MRIGGSEKGQILLIVVITMIVALTVGLSIASRTITQLRLSRQNEESARAFNAAEAGIDRVLQQGDEVTLEEQLGNNANFEVTATEYAGSQLMLNNGEEVDQNLGADVWLSTYPDFTSQISNARITLFWGEDDQTDCTTTGNIRPALEVALLQGSLSNPTISKYLYDTCSARTAGTLDSSTFGNYTIPSIPGQTFLNRITTPISVTNGIIMKIIPLYNSTKVGVAATDASGSTPIALPSQGSVVESTGRAGQTERSITYYQSYPQMPIEIFPYTIISQ